MRLIGHLPNEKSATSFSVHLNAAGVAHQVDSDDDGWGVWIHAEDELPRGEELLSIFRTNPNDPRLRELAPRTDAELGLLPSREKPRERRVWGREEVFRRTMPFGVGPLTVCLAGLCIAIAVTMWVDESQRLARMLSISSVPRHLPEVARGEIWRLLTPIFMHDGVLHLFFNLMWLLDLGSQIEGRQSTRRLATLVAVIGIVSNLAQFYAKGPWFLGMSGVVYGLLGYIWMKGKFDPGCGLELHPQTVAMMLIWFGLCFTPLIPNVANAAHAAGLVLGILWGWGSSLRMERGR